ncbi:MAG TPA: helix-turn-helix domain-containing protein [Kiloniellaceae bacterium]|nr:helix-turn-helix domain-containing protein [Kiloniellaceae bacterium]
MKSGAAAKDNSPPREGHDFRSSCSIARALDLLGDKWTLLIVRDLLWHGKHSFTALQGSAERMPTNILAQRLKKLMAWGLVRREAYQDKPVRYAYELTEAGKTLEPLLLQVMQWGHEQLRGGLYDPKTGKSRGPRAQN